MMRYLDRLKKLDSGKCAPCELPKLQKPPFDSFCSIHEAHFQKTALANDPKVGAGATAAPFDREWFEERAGILEYDAGFTRQEAERRAMKEVSKWLH